MREAMRRLNEERKRDDDLLLKIGIHEGPCLAVMLNERQDYFGQTVNIASRIQILAFSRAIYAIASVVDHQATTELLEKAGLSPVPRPQTLRGIGDGLTIDEIP